MTLTELLLWLDYSDLEPAELAAKTIRELLAAHNDVVEQAAQIIEKDLVTTISKDYQKQYNFTVSHTAKAIRSLKK